MRRLLRPIVELREGETATAVLMFTYSFLAMTSYNIVKPATRSTFISGLGADNLPWVQLVAGILIGFIMQGYSRAIGLVPRRWAIPVTQLACVGLLLALWLPLSAKQEWASVAFYVLGLILGILLISQFWTLANGIYDPRQAKRLFGFVGGGVMLGGMTGSGLTALIIESIGTNALLLVSAGALVACMTIVAMVLGREQGAITAGAGGDDERGVTMTRALQLLRESRQIQIIALIISFGSFGAALLDQQVNMAAEVFKGAGQEDSIGAFLAQIRLQASGVTAEAPQALWF